jgi:hypothetical protein
MFNFTKASFCISFPRAALEAIFDECDRYNVDETGGRLIGTYHRDGKRYKIQVQGIIEPGPNARRSPTSFFQDGEYQETIFRSIEDNHPETEHLGNWHTHHVNGLNTLSDGDRTTYLTTVNHPNHNTDFFYALLVTRKTPGRDLRYAVKHYVFRRNDKTVYEISDEHVEITREAIVWPQVTKTLQPQGHPSEHLGPDTFHKLERVKDQEFFADFYPDFKALLSKRINTLYWKGQLVLLDGSQIDVAAIENLDDGAAYSIIIGSNLNPALADLSAHYENRRFRSARHAVLYLERDLNKALYHLKKEHL